MEDILIAIINKYQIYKETGSESVRQELVNLEVLAEAKFVELGSQELHRGIIRFIHKYLAKV